MDPTRSKLAIYGSGGFAREVAWLAEECEKTGVLRRVVAFIDDDSSRWGSVINGVPVRGLEEIAHEHPDALVVGGVGSPGLRRQMMERVAAAGLAFDTLIAPDTKLSRWVQVGEGTVICSGNLITTNIELGRHVQINLDCTIGHDVRMGDYATLAPGVHVSGWVHLDADAYVGTGASIINGTEAAPIVIGSEAVVGAGACVTKSVEPGSTVVGVPARPR